jgi:hypothetical protein
MESLPELLRGHRRDILQPRHPANGVFEHVVSFSKNQAGGKPRAVLLKFENDFGLDDKGSARAPRAVSSALAGNIGGMCSARRRTRQPGQLCSPLHNPQSEFRIGNGQTGRVPQGGTDGNSFPEIILGWTN